MGGQNSADCYFRSIGVQRYTQEIYFDIKCFSVCAFQKSAKTPSRGISLLDLSKGHAALS